jgi:hypothetical protein
MTALRAHFRDYSSVSRGQAAIPLGQPLDGSSFMGPGERLLVPPDVTRQSD